MNVFRFMSRSSGAVVCDQAQRLLAVLACLLLAACASAPTSAHAHGQAPHASSRAMLPGPGGAVPPESNARGGYYLDDGPGDGPPVDPAAVPDAVPRDEAPLDNANRPYEALGEVYFPDTSSLPFSERGMASWYGRRFNGKRTSSGEAYDMYAMTGAHKTLPIPSYVRVTDVMSGRSVVVRINDRGPFHSGRVIDLSYTAAAKLGFASRGSTEVVVERVFPAGLGELPEQAQAGAPADTAALAHAPPTLAMTLPATHLLTPVAPPAGASVNLALSGEAAARAANAWLPPASEAAPVAAAAAMPATPATPSAASPEDSIVAADNANGSAPKPVAASRSSSSSTVNRLFLQLGAFRNAANAQQLLARARQVLHGFESLLRVDAAGGLSRVRLGPFPSSQDQNAAAAAVERMLHVRPGLVGP